MIEFAPESYVESVEADVAMSAIDLIRDIVLVDSANLAHRPDGKILSSYEVEQIANKRYLINEIEPSRNRRMQTAAYINDLTFSLAHVPRHRVTQPNDPK